MCSHGQESEIDCQEGPEGQESRSGREEEKESGREEERGAQGCYRKTKA
jgi:hypothetical protein